MFFELPAGPEGWRSVRHGSDGMNLAAKRGLTGALLPLFLSFCVCAAGSAEEPAQAEALYVQNFLAKYPKVGPAPALEQYASAERFDTLFLGSNLEANLKDVHNDNAAIAWWLSYYMRALNDMFRATGDAKYLEANLRFVRAVVAATDDKRGKQLFTGRVVKAWGCEKYAERGRAVFCVHTGIITAQMLDFLFLANEAPAFNESLGGERGTLLQSCLDALAVHDRQWREGPEAGAGHYLGLDQENSLENKPIPANRQSAMGWALWLAWKCTGDTAPRDRALAIGHHLRNRLIHAPDGAVYWPYQLAEQPVTVEQSRESIQGEDTSHAGLTITLPLLLAREDQVFTKDDLARLARMALNGPARREDGILLTSITGGTALDPSYIGYPVNYLPLAKIDPEIGKRIAAYYLNYRPTPQALDLAGLIRFVRQR